MKISGICFILIIAVIFCGKAQSETCTHEGVVCLDPRTLGYCMHRAAGWTKLPLAQCGNLCCNAQLEGCVLNDDCSDPVLTTLIPSVPCEKGQLKGHPTDSKSYYYCSRNTWQLTKCPAGKYDDTRKMCAF